MQKTLLHNQSLLDFTLHHCGTLNGIVQMAVENNIGIAADYDKFAKQYDSALKNLAGR